MRVDEWSDAIRHDLAYAIRMIRNQPGFVLTTVLTLALGIGANSAIFTVVNAVLLSPLRYHDPDRLVRISGGATAVRFESIRAAQSFTEAGAFYGVSENETLSGAEGSEGLKSVRVTANFLSILGVAPLAGRSFLPAEEAPGPQVAMISAALWHRRFGREMSIVGRSVRLGGAPCTIIGILPAGFAFPFSDLDVWRPYQAGTVPLQSRINSPVLAVFGRLRPDVSLDQASAELAIVNRQYALANPGKLDAKPDRPEQVSLLKEQLVRNIRPSLWMLFGAVGLVLVIACANVSGLLLARAKSRSREFAIRAALGASRGRLIGQLLTESAVLAMAGGGVGVLIAGWALRGIAFLPGLDLPRLGEVHLDGTVLGFAVILSTVTGILFGLAPSLAASRPDLAGVIKASGETSIAAWPIRWMGPMGARGLLVIGQVALSTILLIGASLLIESLAQLRRVDLGFVAGKLLTMQLALPPSNADGQQRRARLFEEIIQRVESVPGVRSAALMLTLPTTGWSGMPVHVVGRPSLPLNQRPIAILQLVTPGFFGTLGIPLRRGRDFSRRDSPGAPLSVVINEAMARKFWPAYPQGEDPVGQSILAGVSPDPLQIVGIAGDVRQAELATPGAPGIYRPRAQSPPLSAMFAVRTDGDPMLLANVIRSQVTAVDRDLSVADVKTMEEVVDASEGQRKGIAILLTFFAAVGLVLALIGIYGVVAYSVVQRTRELGIRRALGAQEADLLKIVLGQGLMLAGVGTLGGLAGAYALTRVLQGLLFEISPTDHRTFAGIATVLLIAAVAASYVPARHAMRVEPMTALRGDHQT